MDVNANGVSILNAPVSVAANTQSTTSSNFTALSTGTLAVNTLVDFDIDVAGAGAKGAQITLVGNEI
jgi:hypothetical protein